MLLFIGLFSAFIALIRSDRYCANEGVLAVSGDACLHLFTAPVVFNTAETICKELDGHLVSIHNGFMNSQIANVSQASGEVWLGAHRFLNPDQWSWVDGTKTDYTHWAPPGPPTDQDLLCMIMQTNTSNWLGAHCDDTRPFVCLSPALGEPGTAVQIRQNALATPCDDGWLTFSPTNNTNDQYCYYATGLVSQCDYASTVCHKYGAELASIHNEAENYFITNLRIPDEPFPCCDSKGDYCIWTVMLCIGLYANTPGNFQWRDGTSLDYIRWAPGEPTKLNADFCTVLDNGKAGVSGSWHDLECSHFIRSAVCKKKARTV